MVEFIIKRISILLVFVMAFALSCNTKSNNQKIPRKIIIQSVNLILADKHYQNSIYKDFRIERNILVDDVEPFKIDTFEVKMVDKMLVDENQNFSSIYFYKYSRISGGDIEVELTIYPSKNYVKFYFSKKNDKDWKLLNRQDWQF